MVTMQTLLSAALLLLLLGTLTERINSECNETVPFEVVVKKSLQGHANVTFSTRTCYGGILLGGMNRLMASNANFKFTVTQDPDYGPYLESVNGVAGNDKDCTYWQLLVKITNGTIIRLDVGIGCYMPSANEQIILQFSKW